MYQNFRRVAIPNSTNVNIVGSDGVIKGVVSEQLADSVVAALNGGMQMPLTYVNNNQTPVSQPPRPIGNPIYTAADVESVSAIAQDGKVVFSIKFNKNTGGTTKVAVLGDLGGAISRGLGIDKNDSYTYGFFVTPYGGSSAFDDLGTLNGTTANPNTGWNLSELFAYHEMRLLNVKLTLTGATSNSTPASSIVVYKVALASGAINSVQQNAIPLAEGQFQAGVQYLSIDTHWKAGTTAAVLNIAAGEAVEFSFTFQILG